MKYLFYKVHAKDICLIKNILESYDNMMCVSTIDPSLPKIQVTIAPDFEADCKAILEDLSRQVALIPLDEPDNISQGKF